MLKRDKEVHKGGRVPRLGEAVMKAEIGLAKLQTRVETGEGEWRRGGKLLQPLQTKGMMRVHEPTGRCKSYAHTGHSSGETELDEVQS